MLKTDKRRGDVDLSIDNDAARIDHFLTTDDITTPTALGSAITAGMLSGVVAGPIGALAGTVAGGLVGAALNRWSDRRSRRVPAPHPAR